MVSAELFPRAIDSDEEMEVDESDSEQEDIEAVTVKKKKRVAGAASEFASDFVFEGFEGQREDKETEDLKKYLKKTASSTLDDKIAEIRKQKNTAETVEILEVDEEEGVAQLGGSEVRDTVREKQKGGRRRARPEEAFFEEPELNNDVEINFEQMNLSRQILKAIGAAGFQDPTPIQAACIPVALTGKDICACAATGTGKTAAFVLPILERLLYKPKSRSCTRVLVLVPTRELAIQVFQVFMKLSTFSQLEVCLCAGTFPSFWFKSLADKQASVSLP